MEGAGDGTLFFFARRLPLIPTYSPVRTALREERAVCGQVMKTKSWRGPWAPWTMRPPMSPVREAPEMMLIARGR